MRIIRREKMETTPVRHIEHAQKRYICDWCGEKIEIGESYKTWFTYGENTTTRSHPECFRAMLDFDWFEPGGEMPLTGTYRRGCCCGESPEHCECDYKE
jgi:hypothetical protein